MANESFLPFHSIKTKKKIKIKQSNAYLYAGKVNGLEMILGLIKLLR
jgi:hypothetical protein